MYIKKRELYDGWVSLIDIFGAEYIEKTELTTSVCEKICIDIFNDLKKPDHFETNRGDFEHYESRFYDQKSCEVKYKLPDGQRGTYFHVTYSNVLSKLWLDIAFDELKLIYNDYKSEYGDCESCKDDLFRLKLLYYKKEMTYNDIMFINSCIVHNNPTSTCGKNKISFLNFLCYLSSHNVKRFANLIIFHEPITYEQTHKLKIVGDTYYTYKKPKKYIVTPIDIHSTNVYVDYIGYNGFKCYIEPTEGEGGMSVPECVVPFIKQIDDAFNTLLRVNEYKKTSKIFKSWGNEQLLSNYKLNDNIKLYEDENIDFLYTESLYKISA